MRSLAAQIRLLVGEIEDVVMDNDPDMHENLRKAKNGEIECP